MVPVDVWYTSGHEVVQQVRPTGEPDGTTSGLASATTPQAFFEWFEEGKESGKETTMLLAIQKGARHRKSCDLHLTARYLRWETVVKEVVCAKEEEHLFCSLFFSSG
ncbi:hypothetical protein K0M31_005283 [Melipona bicolor]|uniref:Uncharacterized protein n=1 Tax=Melipona bicolor TaxID=60889 RepID=A0AA40FUQ5_9HYME|nr:hypothetical protein K0M31_005283 [Melipona bicolor]